MAYHKFKLGDLVEQYDEINTNGEFSDIDDLQGINSNKFFQECKSNKNDIDLYRYRICRKGMFSYNKATSRNGEKISIAYRKGNDCLVSPSYYCFKVKDEDVLCSEYLDIWFKRPIFDRYARFNSWGSATEFFTFDDFCNTEIMLPSIDEQRKIVNEYHVISNRIKLLEDINKNLENMALLTYQTFFLDYIPYKDNLIETKNGIMPYGWNYMSLDDICVKITDGSHYSPIETENSIYPMLSVKDMGHYGFDYSSCKFMDRPDYLKMLSGDCVPLVDDILIAKDGSYLKEVFIVNEFKEQGILSSIAIFRADSKVIYPEILLYLLKSPRVLQEVRDNYVTGSAITRIVLKNFKKLKLVIPPIEEQKRILPLLRTIRFQISNNHHEISVLNNLLKYQLSVLSKGV